MNHSHLIFCLPVYNEEPNLRGLVETIHSLCSRLDWAYSFVIVDDCSTDASVAILENLSKQFPIVILKHTVNQGPGAAFKTGFSWICDHKDSQDIVVTMDSDGTHSLKTLQMMMQGLETGYDVMIASVYAPGGIFIGVPFVRYVLSMACNFLYQVMFPIRGVKEYTGFYRAYRVEVLRDLKTKLGDHFLRRKGFAAMAELLVHLRQQAVFITEVPMIVRYDRKGGKSKMRIFRTIREHVAVISQNMFKRNLF